MPRSSSQETAKRTALAAMVREGRAGFFPKVGEVRPPADDGTGKAFARSRKRSRIWAGGDPGGDGAWGSLKSAASGANIVRSPTLSGDRSFAIPVPAPPATCTAGDLCYMNADFYPSGAEPPRDHPSGRHPRKPCLRPSSPALPLRPPATCISAARAPRCSTGSMRATPRARCCCASRTPTASVRPRRLPQRSSTG